MFFVLYADGQHVEQATCRTDDMSNGRDTQQCNELVLEQRRGGNVPVCGT